MQQQIKPSFLLLFLLISFGSVSAVLYTPALPEISHYFAVSQNSVQLTITLFLVGYAVGQLLYGPLANRYGRKPALYIGIGVEILASLLCVLSATIHAFWLFVAARLLMALGASVGLKMCFTLVMDNYNQQEATKIISHVMTAFAFGPALGIVLGGYLVEHINWQSCFYFLGFYGLVLLYMTSRMPETVTELDYDALKWNKICSKYAHTLRNKQLPTGALLMGCATAFVYVFAALAPFIAMGIMHQNPDQYGLWSLVPPIGIILGSQLSALLSGKLRSERTILLGTGIMAIGVATMLIAFVQQHLTAIWLFMPMSIIYLGMSLIFANASTLATHSAPDKASASAMVNFVNMGVATVSVLLLGFIATQSALSLPIVFVILVILSLLLATFMARPKSTVL